MSEINYFEADKALEIIGNRRADSVLQSRLELFLGGRIDAEGPFAAELTRPPAVRAEYLARPTVGDLDYFQAAENAGFASWTVTYQDDVFNLTNPKKSNMVRPRLALPKGQIVKPKIAEGLQGYKIGKLPTETGLALGEWWDKLRTYVLVQQSRASIDELTYDLSDWYLSQASDNGWDKQGSKADYYYPRLMGLYATRAVLFCDYDAFPDFTAGKVGAGIASEVLGVEPIIVRWRPQKDYPAAMSEKYRIPECSVDLSCVDGLNANNLKEWLQQEVFQV